MATIVYQGHCGQCGGAWYTSGNETFDDHLTFACGKIQTVSQFVNFCPNTKLFSGLPYLHSVDEQTIS